MTVATSPALSSLIDEETAANLADRAVKLAAALLEESLDGATRSERRRRSGLGRLLADPAARALTFELTDEVLRIDDPRRAADRFAAAVRAHPTAALGPVDRVLLRLGAMVAPRLSVLVMPLVQRRVRAETAGIVLPSEDPAFARHVQRRRQEGVRLNINPLGEAILSDAEADQRLALVLERIARPDVDYVSLKVSSIVANLDAYAFDTSVQRIAERLRVVYRAAVAATPPTFVNLDMEEYRDLELTLAAFMIVLNEPEFVTIDAGIVLQAYLPDAHEALERLGGWAMDRHDRAGGIIKVRLVKGANLAMELAEAELHGWQAAPYGSKADVDASFKVLFERAVRPEWACSLRVGVASHNLFDVAWVLTLIDHLGVADRVEFEMLEGMAPAQARAVFRAAGALLMYTPVVADRDLDASIAYLSRRLDENTAPDNFLRSLFTLTPGSVEFASQEARFRQAVLDRRRVATNRRRVRLPISADAFGNEPDSDPTDVGWRAGVLSAVDRPDQGCAPPQTLTAEIDQVIATAQGAFGQWRTSSLDQRRELLHAVADVMASDRVQTLAVMADEAVKTVQEGDPEISEAIDFARFYGGPSLDRLAALGHDGVTCEGRGVVLVVGPWNFPYAIPAGGVCAALAAGNAVVLKPAPEAVRTAWLFVRQLRQAGVPDELVQLVVCEDGPVGRHLVTHQGVDTVVLTGSYETARLFLGWKPSMRLFAETSGKNALVITAAADLDLAIKDLVKSAFGHAGQKCSAASLAIVEASVYDDPAFRRRLADAVRSVRVGGPTDPSTMMAPLINAPDDTLRRALTTLDDGEQWLVEPHAVGGDELWTPGVRWDVQPNSWFHLTECFGPVLGVMRADHLAHAIQLQNAPAYGLTGGLHSLDPAEIATWLDAVEIGNAYVNRGTTGAIVQRQPFGGWKRSSVGGSAKAGGPHYVEQFTRITPVPTAPSDWQASLRQTWIDNFSVPLDRAGLRCERNWIRYRPIDMMLVRHDGTNPSSLAVLRDVSRITGVPLHESDASVEPESATVDHLVGNVRLRLLTAATNDLLTAAHDANVAVIRESVLAHGHVELIHWVREQSISQTAHRHGRPLDDTQLWPAR